MTDRDAVIGLGANLGSRAGFLRAAVDLLRETDGIEVVRVAPVRVTAPVGPPQPAYFNTAAHVRTRLAPDGLLAACLDIERRLGRERRERWGARTIDLDVLWIDGLVHDAEQLHVPHRELLHRAFALSPLLDLAPHARDPRTNVPLADALLALGPRTNEAMFELGDDYEREEVEHTADEGFVVHARDRADSLAAAAEALANLSIETYSVRPIETRAIAIAADDAEELLADDDRAFRWLAEVLYHLDAHRFAVRHVVVFDDAPGHVRGALLGEPLDEGRHAVRGAIKAVTYHGLEAGEIAPDRYRLKMVVDV